MSEIAVIDQLETKLVQKVGLSLLQIDGVEEVTYGLELLKSYKSVIDDLKKDFEEEYYSG